MGCQDASQSLSEVVRMIGSELTPLPFVIGLVGVYGPEPLQEGLDLDLHA